jgi:serine/threonine protein kinase
LGQSGHGFCVDYWGLGMIVYEMMTGLPPWYTTDRSQLFRRLKSAPLDIPSYFSESSADCVAALLERNPRRRLGVTGIRTAMEHPFFRNISWRALYSRRIEAPVQPCEGWKPPDVHGTTNMNGDMNNSSQFHTDNSNNHVMKLDMHMLDSATQNFDAQFTRMAVESEDNNYSNMTMNMNDPHQQQSLPGDDEFYEDLNDDTFLGFSFDIIKERELLAANSSSAVDSNHTYVSLSPEQQKQQQQQRYRTHHYYETGNSNTNEPV